jgi:methyltransferase
MTFFWLFVSFAILQRLGELILAKRNERLLRTEGAIEYDEHGYKYIVVMHVLFFVSLISEKLIEDTILNPYWYIFFGLFVCAQFLRYWAIASLGKFWNTRILVVPDGQLVAKGPYRYLRHPNYLAVAIEIASIPLLFSCYFTALVFCVANGLLLSRRIRIESIALSQ